MEINHRDVTAAPDAHTIVLTCATCGKSTCAAPPDATAETKFTCRKCCARLWRRRWQMREAAASAGYEPEVPHPSTPRLKPTVDSEVEAVVTGWTLPSVRVEADAIARLVRVGCLTRDAAIDLIGVPESAEQRLRELASSRPREGAKIGRVIDWRKKVAEEFSRLFTA